jgi:hypothetical protein
MNARSLLTRCEIRFGLLPGIVSVRLHAFWNQTGNAAGMNETEFFKKPRHDGLPAHDFGLRAWALDAPAATTRFLTEPADISVSQRARFPCRSRVKCHQG